MQSDHFELIAHDGLRLHGCHWMPGGEARSVICIIHGFGEHIGRYESLSTFLTEKGHAVMGMDLRGHGRSGGKRGYIKSVEVLLSDIGELMIEARKNYLDLPLFLFGHCLGGTLAVTYLLKHKSNELAGAILSSPMFRLAFEPPRWKIRLGNFLNLLIPRFTLPADLDPMELSSDAEISKAYIEDPLVHNSISYSLYKMSVDNGVLAIKNASMVSLPTLVYHGSDDKLTSCIASREFAANGGRNISLRIWENMKHETHNEWGKEDVLNDLNDWINEVIQHAPPA
jgi:acylglycerol lipase